MITELVPDKKQQILICFLLFLILWIIGMAYFHALPEVFYRTITTVCVHLVNTMQYDAIKYTKWTAGVKYSRCKGTFYVSFSSVWILVKVMFILVLYQQEKRQSAVRLILKTQVHNNACELGQAFIKIHCVHSIWSSNWSLVPRSNPILYFQRTVVTAAMTRR